MAFLPHILGTCFVWGSKTTAVLIPPGIIPPERTLSILLIPEQLQLVQLQLLDIMAPLMPVGYIGLGNAGYPMAQNLARSGYRLIVRDADPARAKRFIEEHPECKTGATSDKFNDCEVVITMLPNGEIVRDVLLGPDGVAHYMKPGSHAVREMEDLINELS